jgi:hypothetical protein
MRYTFPKFALAVYTLHTTNKKAQTSIIRTRSVRVKPFIHKKRNGCVRQCEAI